MRKASIRCGSICIFHTQSCCFGQTARNAEWKNHPKLGQPREGLYKATPPLSKPVSIMMILLVGLLALSGGGALRFCDAAGWFFPDYQPIVEFGVWNKNDLICYQKRILAGAQSPQVVDFRNVGKWGKRVDWCVRLKNLVYMTAFGNQHQPRAHRVTPGQVGWIPSCAVSGSTGDHVHPVGDLRVADCGPVPKWRQHRDQVLTHLGAIVDRDGATDAATADWSSGEEKLDRIVKLDLCKRCEGWSDKGLPSSTIQWQFIGAKARIKQVKFSECVFVFQ